MILQIHGEVSGGKLFNLYKENAKIRLITLPEVNKFLEREYLSTEKMVDELGVIRLDQLSLKVDGVKYKYEYNDARCWIATPYPITVNDTSFLCVTSGADILYHHADNQGIRPVVCINSNIQLVDVNGDGVLEIVF